MANEWKLITLQNAPIDIIDGDRGSNYPNQAELAASGYCLFLNAGNVTSTGFNFSDCVFLTREKDAQLRKGKLARNDVVLTTRGTVGNSAYFDHSVPFKNIRINSGMVIFRANQPDLDSRYLYFIVRSALFQSQIVALRTGSAQPQLPIRDINRIEIPIPPPDEQRAIAHILGTLDDKIELNRRMNETLEAIARAIFKFWFIDFDPVRAKMDGRWRKGESLPGLPAHLYELFPDRLVDADLGEIPKGWVWKPFSDTVEIVGGGTPKTSVAEYWGSEIPWFSVVDAPNSSDVWVVDTEKKITRGGLKNSSTRLLPERTTILTARGTVGKIALVGMPMAMNQSCYGLHGRNDAGGEFTYFATREVIADLQRCAHGSVFDTITRDTLATASVVAPPARLIEVFSFRVAPFLERIRTALIESCGIAALRDALLSKLIAGELRAASAERLVGSA